MPGPFVRLASWYLSRQVRSDTAQVRTKLKALAAARGDSHTGNLSNRGTTANRVGRWQNPRVGLGGAQDKAVGGTFEIPLQLDRHRLDALYEFDAMTGRIVDREPDDAIRKGIKLVGFEGFDEDAVKKEIKRLELLKVVGDARRWARLYGGGAIVLAADDGLPPEAPLALQNLRRLRGVYAADRFDVTPASYDLEPGSERFGEPSSYFVGDSAHGAFNVKVHHSRVIRFFGVELPPRLAIQREGWGGSVVDRVWTALRNWATSHEYAANIIAEFTQGVYKLKGLAEILDSEDGEDIIARLEVIRMAQSLIGHIALDAEGEDFEKSTTNVAGLKDVLTAFVDALVAVTEMPRTILLGEQPAGLGASADSEIRVWYDHVAAQQTRHYEDPLRRLLTIMLRGVNGPTAGQVPAGELFEWLPLWQPSEDEKAKTRQANATARTADVTSGVVSADEARRDPEVREVYDLQEDELDAPPAEEQSEEAPTPELEAERQESIEAPPPGESLQPARELGSRLGVSAQSIVNMHRRNEIRAWKIGGRWRFAYSDVLRVAHRGITPGAVG